MNAKSSLRRYLSIVGSDWAKGIVGALTLCLFATSTAFAATYYWKGPTDTSSSATGGAWSTLSNWSTEGAGGADATTLPGASDKFYGRETRAIDLEGQEWTIGGWDSTGDWERYNMALWNGTLNIVGDVTTHSDTIYLRSGAKLVFARGATFTPAVSDGAAHRHFVNSGTELDILGNLNIYKYELEVNSGGTAVINPTKWDISGNTQQQSFLRSKGGVLDLPNGISFSSGSTGSGFSFSLELLRNGTLVFGGPVKKNGKPGYYAASFSNGTIRVIGDVSFDFDSVTIQPDAALSLDVAAGASFDPSGIAAGAGTSITKTGAGDFLFSGSGLSTTTAVNEGGFALCAGDTSYDLSSVTFAAGTVLKLGATGITLSAFDASIANATFAAADGFAPANGSTVFTCADATVLAAAQDGLNATLPTGLSVAVGGNSLVAESHFTFNSTTITDLTDPDGWLGGAVGVAGQPVIIAGAGVAPVMDENTPAYASISVSDGASLTVVTTRDIPAMTLEAGTTLSVASSASSVVAEDRSYSGYIMDTPTLVGTMSSSYGLDEITAIAGHIGGGWLGSKDRLYTYVNTKMLDNGSRLHVQFIYNDSDWTKCAMVDFTKDAQGNIYAQGVGAGYVSPTNDPVDFDEVEYNSASYGTSDTDGAYGVKGLSFKVPAVLGGSSVVTATGDFETVGSGSVTVNVAADCVLDLSIVEVTTEATLVKTGDGSIVFGDELPAGLNVQSGALALQPYVEYDMTGVTLGQGVIVKVAVDGELKPCVATPGQNGTTVYISNDTYVGVGGWNTLANWASGALPDASAVVHVHGEGTVLTFDDATATLPTEIVVEDGATFVVAADVTLPRLTLAPTAKVVFGDGETVVSATLGAALATSADATVTPVALPVLEVASNATLNVTGGTKFKNVDLRLFGTLAGTTLGKIYFGHATAGETAYFAMCLTNATVRTIGKPDNYDGGALYFACPDVDGAVSVVGNIEINNMVVDRRTASGGDGQYDGINFGVNNPTNLPFSVVFTDVSYWYVAQCHIAGATDLTLRNSYLYRRPNRAWAAQGRWTVEGAAKVTYVDSRHFYEYPDGNSIGWNSAVAGHEAVVLTNSVVQWSRPTGNGNSVMTVYDSYYDCAYDEYAPSQGQTLPDLLKGLGVLNIPAGTFFSIRGQSDVTWGENGSGTERTCKIDSAVKFAGGGDLRIENAESGKYFAVIMQGGLNTCSGNLSVSSPENYDAKFFFADGANWAGTVVAGNVALTNLTDVATAATATFGTLDLAADFPIRVWKDNGVYTADAINVGAFVAHGGKLSPVMMSDGEDFDKGDSFVVGKIAKGATLPAVATGWAIKARPIDGDDANDEIVLKSGVGFQIIIR